jgi:hypothetical protein
MKMINYSFNVEKFIKMRHYSSNLGMNIYGKKLIVDQAKNLVFGHYLYQFDSK